MSSEKKLYDAFGELIYAVATADGMIQPNETTKLDELLLSHPRAETIRWSFEYERKKGTEPHVAYHKALQTLKDNGPSREYRILIEVLEGLAAASGRVQREEREIIDGFQMELREHFIRYLDENGLLRRP